jgi:hypothetical protein
VEIAKRSIKDNGGTWYQHTTVEAILLPHLERPSKKNGSHKKATEEEHDGEDAAKIDSPTEEQNKEGTPDAFERLTTPTPITTGMNEEKAKVRNIPRMWIFLSTKPINSLKLAYG